MLQAKFDLPWGVCILTATDKVDSFPPVARYRHAVVTWVGVKKNKQAKY